MKKSAFIEEDPGERGSGSRRVTSRILGLSWAVLGPHLFCVDLRRPTASPKGNKNSGRRGQL